MKKILSFFMLLTLLVTMAPAVLADDAPTVRVSQVLAAPGEEVTVTASLENNPGIMAFVLGIDYDTEKLELISADHTGLDGSWIIGGNAVWVTSADTTYDGDFLLLTFRVKDGADGNAVVTLTCEDGAFANSAEENVVFFVAAGGVTIDGAAEESEPAATAKPAETAKPAAAETSSGTVTAEDEEDAELTESIRNTMLEMTGGEGLPTIAVSTEAPAAEKEDETEEVSAAPEIEHNAVSLREPENEKGVDITLILIVALTVVLVALVVLIVILKKRG